MRFPAMMTVLAIATFVLIPQAATAQETETATPAASATAPLPGETPSPAAPAPARPSGVDFDVVQGIVRWADNAIDETGYEVTYTIVDEESFTFSLAANATSFALPAEVPPFTCTQLISIDIVATRDGIRSEPGVFTLAGACPPPQPTPAALPTTGSPTHDSGTSRLALVLMALGGALVIGGGLEGIRRRGDDAL